MSSKKLQMANLTERLLWLIKEHSGENVSDFAKKTDINQATLHNYTKGRKPNIESLINICNKLNVNINWLLTGKEPKYIGEKDDPGGSTYIYKEGDDDSEKQAQRYNTNHGYIDQVTESDEFGIAVAGLKEIFDSRDPVLLPAIQANIRAFQISVRRERHIQDQAERIKKLEYESDELKDRISALEKQLEELRRRPAVGE